MKLNQHKIWKAWEEKSQRLWSNTHNQKTSIKDPQRVVEKKFLGPTYDTSYLSFGFYDLQLSTYQRIFRVKWNGDNWKIQTITWLVDERGTLLIQNVSWNTGDLNKIIGQMLINRWLDVITLISSLIET